MNSDTTGQSGEKCIVRPYATVKPESAASKKHHVGNPPTSFKNPWPSYPGDPTPWELLSTRFGSKRNFVPVPSREELVNIQKPDWGTGKDGLKATWIGHASFLIETTPRRPGIARGIRVLFDPVFSERTGPYGLVGPKRYSPTPCALNDLPEVDIIVISHNHYDHLDLDTINKLLVQQNGKLKILCGLNNKSVFSSSGFSESDITELDWWDGVEIEVQNIGRIQLACTPTQHGSARGIMDRGKGLWCSWVLREIDSSTSEDPSQTPSALRSVYFAGDTGYRHVPESTTPEREGELPCCPAFKEIGDLYGPFDLALLPIGLYSPRHVMSHMHCAPEETVLLHKDVRSKKSIGMHWGTVRGGLSGQYEDVREPPKRWKKVCESAGLKWGEEAGICDIGETVIV